MGVNTAYAGLGPARWSLAALVLSALGVVSATWLIVGSDGDPSQVRWPLVVLPVAICVVPVILGRRAARMGATAMLALWCFVTGFSIGFLLLPSLAAQVASLVREDG